MKLIKHILKSFLKSVILASLLFMNTVIIAGEKSETLKEKTAMVNGMKVFYRIGGEGPVLLLLHGYTLTGNLWEPFVGKLSKNYTVIIPDLPGHGKSNEVVGNYTFEKFAEVMIGFLDQLGIEEINAVGHSGGGITILNMVTQKPGIIKSMVLIGCTHKFSKEGIEFAERDTFENLSEELKNFYRELHPQGDKQTKKLYDEMPKMLETYNNFDIYSNNFSETNIRSLIILGDRDYYFKPEYAVEMYNALPNSQLWIIPGQGHLPFRADWGGSEIVENIFPEVISNFIEEGKKKDSLGLN